VRWIELALFTVALLVAGLIVPAFLWSGVAPYEALAREHGIASVEMTSHGPSGDSLTTVPFDQILDLHREWSVYVTGGGAPPSTSGRSLWTDDEIAHMADVRRVFEVAKFLVPVALFVIVIRLQRARLRGRRAMWALARDGGLAAAIVVAAIGVLSVVAFEQLFLAFHYLFFPQGNFLFPSTSNLIRLYPDWYWEGISLRVGLSFIAFALALAGVAQLRLRAAK
jgi:integral membrane protein (TIGR01906 family)